MRGFLCFAPCVENKDMRRVDVTVDSAQLQLELGRMIKMREEEKEKKAWKVVGGKNINEEMRAEGRAEGVENKNADDEVRLVKD